LFAWELPVDDEPSVGRSHANAQYDIATGFPDPQHATAEYVVRADGRDGVGLTTFALFAARQLANLGRGNDSQILAVGLGEVEVQHALGHESLWLDQAVVLKEPVRGRIIFSARHGEPYKFQLTTKGIGIFTRSTPLYVRNSVVAAMNVTANDHANDDEFVRLLVGVAHGIGVAAMTDRLTVRSQIDVARAAVEIAEHLADVPATLDNAIGILAACVHLAAALDENVEAD
jgi:hypothetical protein